MKTTTSALLLIMLKTKYQTLVLFSKQLTITQKLPKFKKDLIVIIEIRISLLKNSITSIMSTAQLHSTKPELKFCVVSNPARGVVEIRDGENLWQWSQLKITLNAIRRSTIPQKQFIKEITSNKTKYVLVENGFWKLQTNHSSLFTGQSYFLNDGSQNFFPALAGLSDKIVE